MGLSTSTSRVRSHEHVYHTDPWLRRFSKLICLATLFLIFVGAMVKSTDSGLAVPDWPLSYGMLFPPMIGGVFYEHGHRMVAALVGFLMLCLALWLGFKEPRRWVRGLGYCALGTVVLQGILGGITVLFFLPTPVSVAHGLLAQIFFVLTIIIAYSQSIERRSREFARTNVPGRFLRWILFWMFLILIQLALGAVMRHTGSGLAIPDFPKMGGQWIPLFNAEMLTTINSWRFEHNLDPVTQTQVVYHFLHRAGALAITLVFCVLNWVGMRNYRNNKKIWSTLLWLDLFVIFQLFLGGMTLWTQKAPILTSFHVVTGAAVLGISVLLFLRIAPLSLKNLKQQLCA